MADPRGVIFVTKDEGGKYNIPDIMSNPPPMEPWSADNIWSDRGVNLEKVENDIKKTGKAHNFPRENMSVCCTDTSPTPTTTTCAPHVDYRGGEDSAQRRQSGWC